MNVTPLRLPDTASIKAALAGLDPAALSARSTAAGAVEQARFYQD